MMQKDAVKCIFLLNESVFASKLRRSRVRTALKRRMNIIQNIIHIMFGNVCQCVSILLTPGQWLQDCGCKVRTNVSLLFENSYFNHSCYLLPAASNTKVGTGDSLLLGKDCARIPNPSIASCQHLKQGHQGVPKKAKFIFVTRPIKSSCLCM